MILNAKILRIDALGTPTSGGDRTWTNGPAVAFDCCCTEPTQAQSYALGQVIEGATAVVYVQLPAELEIPVGARVSVQLKGEDAQLYTVLHRKNWIKNGGLSHHELFVQNED